MSNFQAWISSSCRENGRNVNSFLFILKLENKSCYFFVPWLCIHVTIWVSEIYPQAPDCIKRMVNLGMIALQNLDLSNEIFCVLIEMYLQEYWAQALPFNSLVLLNSLLTHFLKESAKLGVLKRVEVPEPRKMKSVQKFWKLKLHVYIVPNFDERADYLCFLVFYSVNFWLIS